MTSVLIPKFLDKINIFKFLSPATTLLVMAFIVAIPRQMGVNGHLVGFDPTKWEWFAPAEVYSGIAMAVLEGLAIAFVAKRWRAIETNSILGWAAKALILGGMVFIAGAISVTTSMYATAAQQHMLLGTFYTNFLVIFSWSTLVTAVNPFIALLIGLVDHDERKQIKKLDISMRPNHNMPAKTDMPKSTPTPIRAESKQKRVFGQPDPNVSNRRGLVAQLLAQGKSRQDIIRVVQEQNYKYNVNLYNSDRRWFAENQPEVLK